ncbi:hypothetical protein AWM70_10885 [Paenibacillus yonginensis]|uniref:Uncharacterized protein n=1 Tax=Paenibacillus yonginensis TaxID=1462996 RepID=A0A1B1N0U9_9BACL|nr:hypothetical protein [Paenibacillus yonginensis]ANS75045.1 hypothetical protein AWM70_10885 [Paenibacillus yonginensis]
MPNNRNLTSRILFWIGIVILAFGFVSGFVAGSLTAGEDSDFKFTAALSVWASYMIPGCLIIGFSEVIRLLQDVRDDLLRFRRKGRLAPHLAGNPLEETGDEISSPRVGTVEEAGAKAEQTGRLFPRLSRENLFPDVERAAKFYKLIKRINALEFYFEVEDKLTVEAKLGDVKRLYFEVKHLVFKAGLEHHPIWLDVVEAIRYVEEEYARMEEKYA